MLIRDRLQKQGDRLFRRRGAVPYLLLPIALLALHYFHGLDARFGENVDDDFEWAFLGVSMLGVALRFVVAGYVPHRTSGRNSRKGQVADVLNTTGVYSVVRHPLYVANFAIFFGFLLLSGDPMIVVVGSVCFYFYYERIAIAEEAFLVERFGASYLAWVDATPAFVPHLRGWRRPDLPFCWRTAIKREYRTACATLLAFALLDQIEDEVTRARFTLDAETLVPLAIATLGFVVIRLLHKRARVLDAPGR